MTQTINRQPFTVSTERKKHSESNYYIQAEFKGLCDSKNDVTVDQTTFAETKNVYVNDNNVLVSRPPLKFADGEAYIINEWKFGTCQLRLHRILMKTVNGVDVRVNDPHTENIDDLFFVFLLRSSLATSMSKNWAWKIPVSTLGWDQVPKVTCVQVEDKIFVWFAGIDFIAFNYKTLSFESAAKYLYFPIKELIVNGIENDVETRNFLTDTYLRRYQYSSFSSVNFDKLSGKNLMVNYAGSLSDTQTKYLYDVEMKSNQETMLVYPCSAVGSNYTIDMVQTSNANIIIRYSEVTKDIEVSFDGKYFRPLPSLANIIGTPMLTKDGFYVVAFTANGVAKCRLVPLETTDFTTMSSVFVWEVMHYLARSGLPLEYITIDSSFTPKGYFETIDNFAYIARLNHKQCIYCEWLTQDGVSQHGYYEMTATVDSTIIELLFDDDLKIHYRYTPGIADHTNIGCIVNLLVPKMRLDTDPTQTGEGGILTLCYKTVASGTTPQTLTPTLFYSGYLPLLPHFIRKDSSAYMINEFGLDCEKFDLNCMPPSSRDDGMLVYETKIYTNLIFDRNYNADVSYDAGDRQFYNGALYKCLLDCNNIAPTNTTYWRPISSDGHTGLINYDVVIVTQLWFRQDDVFSNYWENYDKMRVGKSKEFKVSPSDSNICLTDLYLYNYGYYIELPKNGELQKKIDDEDRYINNNNTVALTYGTRTVTRNIHKMGTRALELGQILSGSQVAYTEDALTADEFLSPGYYDTDYDGQESNYFKIEKLSVGVNSFLVNTTGEIRAGDLVRLVANSYATTLPIGNPGNPYGFPVTIEPYVYPETPSGWVVGNDWPTGWPDYKPLFVNDGVIREWQAGDVLPTGQIQIYGYVSFDRQYLPISVNSTGVWYNIDGTFWTSQLSTDNILYLDEFVNGKYVYDYIVVDVNENVPEHMSLLDNYCFSFHTRDNEDLLEIAQTKYDEDLKNLLLYLPKKNEYKFANRITNLHQLSTSSIGVFMSDEIWYINQVELGGLFVYTKPIKSKLPLGCRDGDELITTLDGQAILFPTSRGITLLTPQDFVATTDQILSYISDTIQEKYRAFYTDKVNTASLITSTSSGHRPEIKLDTYRYWILFYKYMSREILAYDTRNSSWWVWEAPYPIKSLIADDRLHLLLEIDANTIQQLGTLSNVNFAPLSGVSYLFVDTVQPVDIGYNDDIVANTLDGNSKMVTDNTFTQPRRVVTYATSMIEWSLTSQRLHFNAINNYKAIRAINMNVTGDETIVAKLSTTAYRDTYHPESAVYMSIKINDLRTFVKRLNTMHVVNFQYKLENDQECNLKLNSLGIKYEVKEGVR